MCCSIAISKLSFFLKYLPTVYLISETFFHRRNSTPQLVFQNRSNIEYTMIIHVKSDILMCNSSKIKINKLLPALSRAQAGGQMECLNTRLVLRHSISIKSLWLSTFWPPHCYNIIPNFITFLLKKKIELKLVAQKYYLVLMELGTCQGAEPNAALNRFNNSPSLNF